MFISIYSDNFVFEGNFVRLNIGNMKCDIPDLRNNFYIFIFLMHCQ